MTARTPCSRCGRQLNVTLETNGHGRLVEIVEPCGWCERKRAGICQRCRRRPVRAKKGLGLYCAPCYQPAINERVKRRRAAANPLKHRGICADCGGRVYGRIGWALTCADCRAERKRAAARRYYQGKPDVIAARNEGKRRWRQENRDQVRLQKRRDALKGNAAARLRRWRERNPDGPKDRAPRDAQGHRLCLRCPTRLQGRAKLCPQCKAGGMREAA